MQIENTFILENSLISNCIYKKERSFSKKKEREGKKKKKKLQKNILKKIIYHKKYQNAKKKPVATKCSFWLLRWRRESSMAQAMSSISSSTTCSSCIHIFLIYINFFIYTHTHTRKFKNKKIKKYKKYIYKKIYHALWIYIWKNPKIAHKFEKIYIKGYLILGKM